MRCLLALFLLGACGGGAPATSNAEGSSEPAGDSIETALPRCLRDGPDGPRTDYSTVASYRCPDGSTPLGGVPARGAAARLRNVGQGPDGHIVDLYEVPCPGGPVRLYVDGYHCGPGVNMEVDPNALTPEQLRVMAARMRELKTIAFDPRAQQQREAFVEWLRDTSQVHLSMCPAVIEEVVRDGHAFRELMFQQFVLSMGAAVIELSDAPEHRDEVAFRAVAGALRLYLVMVGERGASAADARIGELTRLSIGELRQRVAALNAQCAGSAQPAQPSGMGMMMTNDAGENVWPPSGPECERFVRCCEGNGLVRNGAAVAGTAGLMCLLAAAPPDIDCAAGLSMLQTQGVECPP